MISKKRRANHHQPPDNRGDWGDSLLIRGSRREPWPPIDMSSEYLCQQYLGLEAMWQVSDRCFSFSRHAQRQPPTSGLARGCREADTACKRPGGSRPCRRVITRWSRPHTAPHRRTGPGAARHPGGKTPARDGVLDHPGRHPHGHRNVTRMSTQQPLSACRVTSSRACAGRISRPATSWLLVLSPGAFNDHICRLPAEVAQEHQECAGELRRGCLFCGSSGA